MHAATTEHVAHLTAANRFKCIGSSRNRIPKISAQISIVRCYVFFSLPSFVLCDVFICSRVLNRVHRHSDLVVLVILIGLAVSALRRWKRGRNVLQTGGDFLTVSATTKIIPPKPQRFIKSFHELESIKSGICAIFCILSLAGASLKEDAAEGILLRFLSHGLLSAPCAWRWTEGWR